MLLVKACDMATLNFSKLRRYNPTIHLEGDKNQVEEGQ